MNPPPTRPPGPKRPGGLPRVLRAAFRFYRAGLSPLIGPACRYEPTCSHYAEEAIGRWGFARGSGLALWRLLRCHPFARGGIDPVPDREPRGVGETEFVGAAAPRR